MASRRALIALAALSLAASGTTGCRRLRRHPHRAHAPRRVVSDDPRAGGASQCWDPRFVSGSRVQGLRVAATASRGAPLVLGEGEVAVAYLSDGRVWLARAGSDPLALGPARDATAVSVSGGAHGVVVAWETAEGAAVTQLGPDLVVRCTVQLPAGARRPRAVLSPRGVAWAALDGRGALAGEHDPQCGQLRQRRVADRAAAGIDLAVLDDGLAVAWSGGDGVVSLARWRTDAWTVREVHRSTETPGPVRIAVGARRVAVAWSDTDTGSAALRVRAVDTASLSPLGEAQRLSARFDLDDVAALAWDGGAFALAWSEPVSGGERKGFAALVDREGRRIGTAMRVVTEDPVGLEGPGLTASPEGFVMGFTRTGGGLDLRRVGPWLCDAPRAPAVGARHP